MNDELTINEKETLEALYKSVANRIVHGESTSSIISDLLAQGWSSESALELVNNIEENIEEYEPPPEEWKLKKARKFRGIMLSGLGVLIVGVCILIFTGFSLIPIGILIVGAINFFWGYGMWSKYRK
jgi:hypothetical protein